MKNFLVLCLLFLGFVLREASAQKSPTEQSDYWVVIGAFAVKENAAKFSEQARKLKLNPKIELNPVKNLYYVLVAKTSDRDDAVLQAARIRELGKYSDAWVFIKAEAPPAIEEEPVVAVEEPVKSKELVVPVTIVTPPVVDSAKIKDEMLKEKVNKQVMSMKKGEMETLDYIFFYKDASVLRPESKYEVDRLVKNLKEYPNVKIRIHGHTNGNDKGKIIRRSNTSTDFFSLENTVEDWGSAKELSEERANAIRDYLIANGINKDRMTVKAWGGKKPLYPVDDIKAEANVRVEIEVVKED